MAQFGTVAIVSGTHDDPDGRELQYVPPLQDY